MKEDYKVADISLAEFGRREISLAENEMPALMALREKYKEEQPLSTWKVSFKPIKQTEEEQPQQSPEHAQEDLRLRLSRKRPIDTSPLFTSSTESEAERDLRLHSDKKRPFTNPVVPPSTSDTDQENNRPQKMRSLVFKV